MEGLRVDPARSDLIKFFDNSSDFAFTSNVDRYLHDHADTAFTGVSDVPALTNRSRACSGCTA